jgi:hypothetical protein
MSENSAPDVAATFQSRFSQLSEKYVGVLQTELEEHMRNHREPFEDAEVNTILLWAVQHTQRCLTDFLQWANEETVLPNETIRVKNLFSNTSTYRKQLLQISEYEALLQDVKADKPVTLSESLQLVQKAEAERMQEPFADIEKLKLILGDSKAEFDAAKDEYDKLAEEVLELENHVKNRKTKLKEKKLRRAR